MVIYSFGVLVTKVTEVDHFNSHSCDHVLIIVLANHSAEESLAMLYQEAVG